MPGRVKSLTGTVVSDKMEQTVIVRVETTARHRLYHKIIKRSRRYLAHDDRLGAKAGDLVRIVEARPMSRHKRWRVAEIVQRGEVVELAPREIDTQYLELHRERQAPPAPAPAAEASPEEAKAAAAAPLVTEEPAGDEAPAAEAKPLEEPAAEAAPAAAEAEAAPDATGPEEDEQP
jgi:small subunit ribosomal protein S17